MDPIQEIIAQVNHFSPKLTTLFLETALANKPPILEVLLKMLDKSVNWLKSYGQKVYF